MKANRFDHFVTLLSQLPASVWEALITQAPSCQWLKPYSQSWPFGPFAALYVMLGLNNYQLKGKAEIGYWPKVVPLMPRRAAPKTPDDLRKLLLPFFQKERMADQKVNRLDGFTGSSLCLYIWDSDATSIAAEFSQIWHRLARTMNQKPEKKTLAFAMKCLAYSLILVDETGFDFGTIPVPVDSRVSTISRRLGLPSVNDNEERARWKDVLKRIRKANADLTMVHLDSILWQIGTLSQPGVVTHLRALGTSERDSDAISDIVGPSRAAGY